MDTRNRRNKGNLYDEEQIRRVLTGSGIDVYSDLSSDYMVFCPFHNNVRTPAAEVNKETGTFFCFSCQKTASLNELIMHTSGRSYFEAERFIQSKAADIDLNDQVAKKLKKQEDYVPFDELLIKRLNIQALESSRAMNYYQYRKITQGSVEKFQLGYSEKQDMITIPVHAPDGMLLGFVGRSIEGKTFKNTPGLPKSKTLFNVHRIRAESKVYVVESSFDAIRLDQVGIPAVATLGANVSNFQIELLQKYFNNIFVIADNDEAGDGMAKRIQARSSIPVSVIKLNKQYKDIGDMPDDEIKKLDISFDSTIANMLK